MHVLAMFTHTNLLHCKPLDQSWCHPTRTPTSCRCRAALQEWQRVSATHALLRSLLASHLQCGQSRALRSAFRKWQHWRQGREQQQQKQFSALQHWQQGTARSAFGVWQQRVQQLRTK